MTTKTRTIPAKPTAPAPGEEEDKTGLTDKARAAADHVSTGCRTVRRYRYGLAPFATMGGLWAAGSIAHNMEASTPVMLAAGALAGGAAAFVNRDRLASVRRRLWATSVTAGGVAWLGAATALGIVEPLPAILAGGTAVLGAPWWYHYRNRCVVPAPERPALTAPEVDTVWQERVAGVGGRLPKSSIGPWESFEYGKYASGWVDGGRQITADAVTASTHVASAYRVRPENLTIEQHPDGEEGHFRVTMLTRNPLTDIQPWSGPALDPEQGFIPIGPYMDGMGVARIRLFRKDYGAIHTMIAGTTGSGKSYLVDRLITEVAYCPVAVPWVIDCQEGQSVPDWQDKVKHFGSGVDEGVAMMKAADKIMFKRSAMFGKKPWIDEKGRVRKGRASFTPTEEHPLLVIFIEECHMLFENAEAVEIAKKISKMGRKTGIALVLITQVPSAASLGNSTELRSMVASGNVIVLRTQGAFTGHSVLPSALPMEPHKLPLNFADGSPTDGLGFVIAPNSGRAVPMRSYFTKELYDWIEVAPVRSLEPQFEEIVERYLAAERKRAAAEMTDEDDDSSANLLGFFLGLPDGQGVAPSMLVAAGFCKKWTEANAALEDLADLGFVHEVQEGIFEIDAATKDRLLDQANGDRT